VKLTDDVKQRKQKHFKQYRTAKQKQANKENLVRFLHRGKPRHLISCAGGSGCCCFGVSNVGRDGAFPEYSRFSTVDLFRFEEIVSGNGVFQEI